jgi:hypothetical protein
MALETDPPEGAGMDNDALQQGIRRFLKEFGITAQKAIEDAVAAGLRTGSLEGDTVHARARLEIPALGTYLDIERDLPLE